MSVIRIGSGVSVAHSPQITSCEQHYTSFAQFNEEEVDEKADNEKSSPKKSLPKGSLALPKALLHPLCLHTFTFKMTGVIEKAFNLHPSNVGPCGAKPMAAAFLSSFGKSFWGWGLISQYLPRLGRARRQYYLF